MTLGRSVVYVLAAIGATFLALIGGLAIWAKANGVARYSAT
jgi:hypothetical protein